MLEMFFDNEKSFAIFDYLLHSKVPHSFWRIAYDLKLSENQVRHVIDNFDLLNMIKYHTENPTPNPMVYLNMDNPIVLGICILDELVEKYFMDDTRERIQENGDFQQLLGNVSVEDLSVNEFVGLLKQLNK